MRMLHGKRSGVVDFEFPDANGYFLYVVEAERFSLSSHRRLLGDLDALLRLLRDAELSRLRCSNSFLFPATAHSGALDRAPSSAGVPDPLVLPDLVAETNSRGPLALDCSFAFRICFCDALSSSA